jgi:hypothetical protein
MKDLSQIKYSDLGFKKVPLLSSSELDHVRKLLIIKINNLLGLKLGSDERNFEEFLSNYSNEAHQKLLIKTNRILSQDESLQFIKLESIQKLISSFPGYKVGSVMHGNKTEEDRPEIYFRIVRPKMENDIGPLHCDSWFNQLYNVPTPNGNSFKTWISIYSEPGKNGLMVVPKSHNSLWNFRKNETNDGPRPFPAFEESNLNKVLVETNPGDAIIFPCTLLHGGAVNQGRLPRVSMEITFF